MISQYKSLPKNWILTKIEDICTNPQYGYTTKASQSGNLRLLRTTDITSGRINWNKVPYCTKNPDDTGKYLLKDEDIVISRAGSVGVSYLIKDPEKAIFASYLIRFKPLINKSYFKYFLDSPFYWNSISEKKLGIAVPNVNANKLKSIILPLSPLEEQNRIVEKIEELFSDLDKATEDLKKTQEQLKIYRQSVLKAAFEGKLTEKWRRNNPYEKNYLEKIHRSIKNFNFIKTGQDVPRRLPPLDFLYLPSLPDNWLWVEAHKICTSVRDGTHDTPKYIENGNPLITSKNLKNGKIDFNNVQFISKKDHKEISKRSFVENDDILFGMIGTIGNPVIVKCKKEFSIKNVGLFKKNYDYIIPKYLRYWLESSKLFKILKEKDFIKGTTQKFISLGNLRILPIPLSSLEEQYEIVNEIESRLSVCDKLEETVKQSLEQIDYLRQSILKKAFEGKLVSQDPNDEPAEKLLERIKQEKEKFESNNKKRKKR